MKHWARKRKVSLMVHSIIVLIPLLFGTISALLFWERLFQSWWVAVPMVVVIDVLALLGLILFVCRIQSPFIHLRHALPFVSIVPLGVELWLLLIPRNSIWVAAPVTVLATAIMVGVAWRCYSTIEQLFVDPLVAAAELMDEQAATAQQRMTQQVQALTSTLTALSTMQAMAAEAVQRWSQQQQISVNTPVRTLPEVTVSRQAVKQYADRASVSERTVWRHLEQGKLSAADIVADTIEEG